MSEAPEADEYVDDENVRWDDLAETSLAAFVTLIAITIAEVIGLISTGVTSGMSATASALGGLIRAPFTSGLSAIDTAWMSSSEFVSIFGPAAFLVAVLLVAVSVLLLLWGVNRFA